MLWSLNIPDTPSLIYFTISMWSNKYGWRLLFPFIEIKISITLPWIMIHIFCYKLCEIIIITFTFRNHKSKSWNVLKFLNVSMLSPSCFEKPLSTTTSLIGVRVTPERWTVYKTRCNLLHNHHSTDSRHGTASIIQIEGDGAKMDLNFRPIPTMRTHHDNNWTNITEWNYWCWTLSV